MTYYPDKWLLIKTPQCTKVFGVWHGGYIHGDSWKLNSGISGVEETVDSYLFHGYSGSIYHCHKDKYGSSPYGYSVIHGFGDQVQVVENIKQELSSIQNKSCLQTVQNMVEY